MSRLSRRDLLRSAPAAALPLLAGRALGDTPAKTEGPFPGLTERQHQPQNLEFPFPSLKTWATPTEQFYVRNHFPYPKVDAKNWRVSVEGLVGEKLELTLDDLRKLGEVTRPLTLECAGNSRVFIVPPARGLQWGHGAVGNAEWTGVPLAAVLERAKAGAGAVEVVLVGADTGAITADPATPGVVHFARSLPIDKAKKDEVILATKMNGEDVPMPHGGPLRAVVGGWYGMASVKWLTKIVVTDKPYGGYFQTMDYSYWVRREGGLPQLVPVTAIQPKAAIARPSLHETVPAGRPYRVYGAAWTGEGKVAKVEVSADGGATWAEAKLTGEDKPFCWRTWEFSWTPSERGPARLVARATTDSGATQPDKRDPDRRSYMINHLAPVEVLVR